MANHSGAVLVLIPPLLVGAESAGSLRGDMRSWFANIFFKIQEALT